MRKLLSGIIIAAALAAASPALARLPECTEVMLADLQSPTVTRGGNGQVSDVNDKLLQRVSRGRPMLVARFKETAIKYPFGSLNVYGFTLTYVVDENGRTACATIKPVYRFEGTVLNAQRLAFLDEVSRWQFDPYVIDGKAVRVRETFPVREEELPKAHIPPPSGDPAQVTITQYVRPFYANYGPYHVELHGDGTAIYTSGADDDPLGPQTYHVDAKAVVALVAKASAVDFWSLRDQYRSINRLKYDEAFDRVNITLGGVTKSLTTMNADDAGLSYEAEKLTMDVMDAANVRFWQTPTLATIQQLKLNSYDFQADRAGVLLLRMTQNPDVKDDAVLAVMDLGAPQDASAYNGYLDERQNFLQAALATGRLGIAKAAIKVGALLTDGKPDQYKLNWAFQDALLSNRLAVVDFMLTYHPDLTYDDYDSDDKAVHISIIRKLNMRSIYDDDRQKIAERLLSLGADINAKAADGTTLLHEVMLDKAFAVFLLDHGADINALDTSGDPPLARIIDEDLALVMLDRGANPRLGTAAKGLRFNIENNHWTRVKAWLVAHNDADLLVAPADEAKVSN